MALRAILSNDNPVTVRAEARTCVTSFTVRAEARTPASVSALAIDSSRAIALEQ